MDAYYGRKEVSNSDLSTLKKELYGEQDYDPTAAYKFGTLIDILITEPNKINYLEYKADGEQYSKEDFERVRAMKKSFMRDELARKILEASDTQKVMIEQNYPFEYEVPFSLSVRCKWDLWMQRFGWGGDLKSTTAETQKQFEDAARYFDYDRQRWWYMNIANSPQDVLIAISKVNFKLFKIHIKRGDDFWKSGREKALHLAFKWWMMFGEVKP